MPLEDNLSRSVNAEKKKLNCEIGVISHSCLLGLASVAKGSRAKCSKAERAGRVEDWRRT